MKRSTALGWVVPMLYACGGNLGARASNDAGSLADSRDDAGTQLDSTARIETGAQADSAADAPTGRVPVRHRPTPVACTPAMPPPEPVIPDAGLDLHPSFVCHVHGDCTQAPRGFCVLYQTTPPGAIAGTHCVYDQCQMDADCGDGGVCSCESLNVCLGGNCRVDGDCGPGRFCSPDLDPCSTPTSPLGHFCHTTADQCVDDADCNGPTQLKSICGYDVMLGYWACQRIACAAMGQ